MQSERLQKIKDTLGITDAAIAEASGINRSSISRLRNDRQSRQNSESRNKLIQGLLSLAKSTGKEDALLSLMGRSDSSDPKEALAAWLYEGEPLAQNDGDASLAKRLHLTMSLIDCPNIRLAHLVHADPSLISRIRHGQRTLSPDSDLSVLLSEVLYDQIQRSGKATEMAELMQISENDYDLHSFRQWLTAAGNSEEQKDAEAARQMISAFGSYGTYSSTTSLPSFEEAVPPALLNSPKNAYFGTEGLREGVLRFLAGSVQKPGTLYLYSDQDMDWMVSDPAFRAKWAALMSLSVKSGNRIKIIHHLDRGISEMMSAITSWVPLYLSGMVESWYSTRQRNIRFYHTLFISSGNMAISGFHPAGAEGNEIYRFDTDPEALASLEETYEALLKSSMPLSQVLLSESGINTSPGVTLYAPDGSPLSISDAPFQNLALSIREDSVTVTSLRQSSVSIRFLHPLICRAFRAYADELRRTTSPSHPHTRSSHP